MDLSVIFSWTSPFPHLGVSGLRLSFLIYILNKFLKTNSSSASDPAGLHCMPNLKKVAFGLYGLRGLGLLNNLKYLFKLDIRKMNEISFNF